MTLAGRVREVETTLIAAAQHVPPEAAERLRAYHGTKTPHLGLAVPAQRLLLRRGYSFSCLPAAQQLPIWNEVWRRARHHEAKSQALYYCAALRRREDLVALWPVVCSWIDQVDNWDDSDELSSIYARILEELPEAVYPVLRRWNRSDNPWQRRQSILSLLYHARARRAVLPAAKILPLIEQLIGDGDRFVQKAVGWALREAHAAHPAPTLALIRRHARVLSAVAFAEATRKLPAPVRAALKTARAAASRSNPPAKPGRSVKNPWPDGDPGRGTRRIAPT